MTRHDTKTQLNIYKYTEMEKWFEGLMAEETEFQRGLGRTVLREWCQTEERDKVIDKWANQNKAPKPAATSLSILHFNIRSFYSISARLGTIGRKIQAGDYIVE